MGIPPEFRRNSAEFRIPVVFLSRFFRFRFRFRSEKKVPAFFFFFFNMTEPIPAINFRVFSAGKFRNSVFGSGIPDSGSPRNRNPKSEFPTKFGGGGMILRGTMFIFCPAMTMMFVVDRNSVKYALDTQNHTPQGYEGMKNRCLWKGPQSDIRSTIVPHPNLPWLATIANFQ